VPGKDSRWIFAKIRTFATWVSYGTRAEEKLHVFDALCAPEHACARPASRQRPADAMARARAYKAHSGVDHTLPRTLKPHRSSAHRRLPVHGVSAPPPPPSPCRRRPASPAFPNPVRPSETSEHISVKLPERGIEACFAGEASPRSLEFTTPPECVDRVIH
jgi:hypothetical protein